MSYTREEKIEFEIGRLKENKYAQKEFFEKAVDIQKSESTYTAAFADGKKYFACDVLNQCGWCRKSSACKFCKLAEENEKAKMEINNGKRNPSKGKYLPGYWISTTTAKNGVVNITLRPFRGNPNGRDNSSV